MRLGAMAAGWSQVCRSLPENGRACGRGLLRYWRSRVVSPLSLHRYSDAFERCLQKENLRIVAKPSRDARQEQPAELASTCLLYCSSDDRCQGWTINHTLNFSAPATRQTDYHCHNG